MITPIPPVATPQRAVRSLIRRHLWRRSAVVWSIREELLTGKGVPSVAKGGASLSTPHDSIVKNREWSPSPARKGAYFFIKSFNAAKGLWVAPAGPSSETITPLASNWRWCSLS
ncbi:hypothetical protein JCM17961_34940 [Endothiovibrio diazotrophicus]